MFEIYWDEIMFKLWDFIKIINNYNAKTRLSSWREDSHFQNTLCFKHGTSFQVYCQKPQSI